MCDTAQRTDYAEAEATLAAAIATLSPAEQVILNKLVPLQESVRSTLLFPHMPHLVHHPAMAAVLHALWTLTQLRAVDERHDGFPKKSAFALALLLAHLDQHHAPAVMNQFGVAHRAVDATLTLAFDRTDYLCDQSEPRLQSALDHHTHPVVVVNDTLVTKIAPGRIAALAVEMTPTAHGMIVPGNWYTPADPDTKKQLVAAYYAGTTHLQMSDGSTWTLVRTMSDDDCSEQRELAYIQARLARPHASATLLASVDHDARRAYFARHTDEYISV